MNGGTIGEEEKDNPIASLILFGKAYLTGGMIFGGAGKAISLRGKNAKLFLCPDHLGAVNLSGFTPYIKPIKLKAPGVIEVDVPKDDRYLYLENCLLCAADTSLKNLEQMATANTITLAAIFENENEIKLSKKNQYIFIKAFIGRKNGNKTIECKRSEQICLYSKPKCFGNFLEIEKSDSQKV